MGIALRDTSGEFRSMSDVLDDVNARWTTFSSLERNQIAQAIAGKFMPEHIVICGVFIPSSSLYR